MVFDSEDLLMSHSRDEANRCQIQPEQALDGITLETEWLLRSRKKEYRGQSKLELWRKMYRTLFPDEIVPSPCKLALSGKFSVCLSLCTTAYRSAIRNMQTTMDTFAVNFLASSGHVSSLLSVCSFKHLHLRWMKLSRAAWISY
jgi:hypothetical protein